MRQEKMKFKYIIGALFAICVVTWSQPTRVNPAQLGVPVAFLSTDIFDLRDNLYEKNAFSLNGKPVVPTLATVWVYADGKLLAEGIDYSIVSGTPWQVHTVAMYQGVVIQIRYYKGQL